MRLLFIILVCVFWGAKNERINPKDSKINTIEKKILLLEKKIESLQKKIAVLEQRISSARSNEEFPVKFISKERIESKNKELIKIEATLQNNTSKSVRFVFGQIYISDPTTDKELFSDNFYYDKQLQPYEAGRIIIAIPSSHPSYNEIKNLSELKIRFTPRVVKN